MVRVRDEADQPMKLHDISYSSNIEQLDYNNWIKSDEQITEYKNNYGNYDKTNASSNWRIFSRDDGNSEIQLWVENFSLSIGDELILHLAAKSKNIGTVEIYRLGWYDGVGGLKVSSDELELPKGDLWTANAGMPNWRDWPILKTISIDESFQYLFNNKL